MFNGNSNNGPQVNKKMVLKHGVSKKVKTKQNKNYLNNLIYYYYYYYYCHLS